MQIINGKVFTSNSIFEHHTVCLNKQKIASVSPSAPIRSKDLVYDASGCYVIPGLTDIHLHGCNGYDFCDGTPESLDAMVKYERLHGITTMCFATMTLSKERLSQICENAARYHRENPASFCGIYLEGPFLSVHKKGAQDESYMESPSLSLFHDLQQSANGLIKIITVAPELEGSFSLAEQLKHQVIVSMGHSEADYPCAMHAFDSGFSNVTHLFNAMPPFSHRDPGIIGAAFDRADCTVELICDGVHTDLSMIRATLRLFGDNRVIFISDSMMATGLMDGNYSLGGQSVAVRKNCALLSDGTIAGSVSNLYECMKTAVFAGISLESAVKCACVNPAKALGIYHHYGSLEEGKYANILILNEDLSIKDVIFEGTLLSHL